MKKIISLLVCVILVLSVTGCSKETSTKKTEEELREEIRAEMEAEKKKGSEEQITTLTGTILPNYIPMGVGIRLDAPINIGEMEVLEVYFDEDIITDLVPREYFTYYFEGGTSINSEYTMQIPIKVEIDSNSFNYAEDLNRTSAVITKVVSIDGEENPQDKTNDDYTLDYYKTVFYTYCYEGNDIRPSDVKDTYFYNNLGDPIVGDVYRTAVDKILERGFYINMGEGEYMIENEPKTYSDGEADITPATFASQPETEPEPEILPPSTFEEITPSNSGLDVNQDELRTSDDEQELYDTNGKEVMDTESKHASNITEPKYDGSKNITGYSSETINGKEVDYSDCIAVVVPNYNGKHVDKLKEKCKNNYNGEYSIAIGAIKRPYKAGETGPQAVGQLKTVYNNSVTFAVFGKLDSITVKYQDAANNKIETQTLTEAKTDLKNKIFRVVTNFTNDRTAIEVTFTTTLPDGRTYRGSFSMNDMKENYDPIMVKFK